MEETIKAQASHLTVRTYVEIASAKDFLTLEWKSKAACAKAVAGGHIDPLAWFPLDDNIDPTVKAICDVCPVRLPCLVFAIYINETHGVWGGYRGKVIRKMRRQIYSRTGGNMPRAMGATSSYL